MLIVTCPGTNAHKDAVKNAMTEAVESQFNESDNSFGKAFGSFVSQLMVNFSLDNVLTVDNYFVCSVGRIHLAGFDRTVSFGILGHVYTVNMDMAEEALKKSSKGKGKSDESFSSDSSDDSDYDAAADDEAADRLLDQVSSLADSSTSKTIDDARKAGAEVNKAVQHAASTVDRASSVLDKAASALDKFLDDAQEGQ